MHDKILFEKYPAPTDFRTGDAARFCSLAQFFGVHMEETRGFLQIK